MEQINESRGENVSHLTSKIGRINYCYLVTVLHFNDALPGADSAFSVFPRKEVINMSLTCYQLVIDFECGLKKEFVVSRKRSRYQLSLRNQSTLCHKTTW